MRTRLPVSGDPERLDGRLDPIDGDVGQRKRRTLCGEALDHGGTEAAADAGDRDDAAVELAHQAGAPAAVRSREGLPSSAGCSFGASWV